MKSLMITILCFFTVFLNAQEESNVASLNLPVRNSLTFNRYVLNPTFSFVREQHKFISIYNKREWVQFENAPLTYLGSFTGRFSEKIGAGIGVFQQNNGVLTTFGGILNFAYNAQLQQDSNLTFGLNIGAFNSGLNSGSVTTNFDDPALQNIPENFLLTVSPGINYGLAFFDIGVSVNNLVAYNLNTSEMLDETIGQRSIQGHIMYTGYLRGNRLFNNSKFTGLIRSEFRNDETIIAGMAMLTIPRGLWLQAGYNSTFGVSAGLGLNITEQFALEYNFERTVGDLLVFGPSHDITLAYRFKSKDRYDVGPDDEVSGLFTKKRKQKVEKLKLSKEEVEQRRLAAEEKKIKEQAEKEIRLEEQQKAKEEAEAQRLAKEKAEQEAAAEAQRLAAAQKAREEAEALRLAQEKAEQEAAAEAQRLAAAQKAKEEAEALRLEKEKAEQEAAAEAQRLAAAQKAREEAEALRLAQEKAEQEAAAEAQRLAEEQKAKEEAEAQRLAQEKAEKEAATEAQRLAAEQKAKEEAEAQRLAQEKAEQEAAAEAQRLAEEQKAKEEAEARRLAQEKAEQEAAAEAQRLAEEQKAKEDALKDQIENPADAIGKEMYDLAQEAEQLKIAQDALLKQFDDIVNIKDQDLADLKEENDLNEQGITVAPKAFKSVTEENRRLQKIKDDLEATIEERSKQIEKLKERYDEKYEGETIVLDEVYLYYKGTLERLNAEQLAATQLKAQLESRLAEINVKTEFERSRRIKRAAFDNEDDRYENDRASLENIKRNTPIGQTFTTEDFDFGEEQSSNIQILKNVSKTSNGYYLILAVHTDIEKRDDFVKKVYASGRANVDFFYDVKTSKYYIYYEKFDRIQQANEALKQKGTQPYNEKMSLIKIEN